MGHTYRGKLRGVSSESQKSYSGLDPCWPSAAGGRKLSHIKNLPKFGKTAAVTVVTVGVTAGDDEVTAGGVGGCGRSIFGMMSKLCSLHQCSL